MSLFVTFRFFPRLLELVRPEPCVSLVHRDVRGADPLELHALPATAALGASPSLGEALAHGEELRLPEPWRSGKAEHAEHLAGFEIFILHSYIYISIYIYIYMYYEIMIITMYINMNNI